MRSDLFEFSPATAQSTSERRALVRRELASDIVSAAYLRGDFVLNSGEHSDYYFDKYLFETKPTILRRLAEALAERVPDGVDRLAGTEVGGIALVTAVSLATGIPFVLVRSGEGKNPIKGELHPGERVALVLDVVDSGNQATTAAAKIHAVGAQISGILAVIDRDAAGARAIAAAGYHYDPLFNLSELDI